MIEEPFAGPLRARLAVSMASPTRLFPRLYLDVGGLKLKRGVPKVLSCDNGSGFTSHGMDLWAYPNGAKIDFLRPGKPTDNAFVESFNETFRNECLNTHWFFDLKGAQTLIEAWRQEYSDSRPHASLDDRTPCEFASQYTASRVLAET